MVVASGRKDLFTLGILFFALHIQSHLPELYYQHCYTGNACFRRCTPYFTYFIVVTHTRRVSYSSWTSHSKHDGNNTIRSRYTSKQ